MKADYISLANVIKEMTMMRYVNDEDYDGYDGDNGECECCKVKKKIFMVIDSETGECWNWCEDCINKSNKQDLDDAIEYLEEQD